MNGHIEPRSTVKGKKRWRVLVFVDAEHGGPKRVSVGTFAHLRGDDGAEKALKDTLEAFATGEYGGPCKLTVKQLIERWFRDGPERRETTLAGYRKAAKDHIYSIEIEPGVILGELLAATATPAQWATWQAGQLKAGRRDGKACSPKSVRDYRAVAHGAYAWACGVDLLHRNPLAKVKTPALPKRRRTVPDLATLGEYIAEVRKTRYWMPVVLGCGPAMRRGEILGLRWCDVDLASGRTRICRQIVQIGRDVSVSYPKTDAGYREITLPAFTLDALKEHKREVAAQLLLEGRSWDDEAPICGDIKPDRLTHGLRQLFLKRKLPPVHMHTLRHAVATDMLRRGTNPRVVQEYLGHAHVATTLGTYGHIDEDDLASAAEAFDVAWRKAQEKRSAKRRHHSDTKNRAVVDIGTRRLGKTPAERSKPPEDAG